MSLFDIKLCDKRKLYSLLLSWFRILFFALSSHFGWFAIHSWVACNGCVQLWSTYLLVLHSFSWTDQKSGADSLHIGPKSRRRFVGVPKPLKVFEHTCEHAGKFITVKHKTAQTINFLVGWWCLSVLASLRCEWVQWQQPSSLAWCIVMTPETRITGCEVLSHLRSTPFICRNEKRAIPILASSARVCVCASSEVVNRRSLLLLTLNIGYEMRDRERKFNDVIESDGGRRR